MSGHVCFEIMKHNTVLRLGRESCRVSLPGLAKPAGTEKDSGPDEGSAICLAHTASWDMLNWTKSWWTGRAAMVGTAT